MHLPMLLLARPRTIINRLTTPTAQFPLQLKPHAAHAASKADEEEEEEAPVAVAVAAVVLPHPPPLPSGAWHPV